MILSEIGVIADKYWREIPDHFPNIKLDEFIIMPDHIHGIDFAWQPRYYDHIIRTRIELYRIRKYIRENPEKWICDSHNFNDDM